MKKIYVGQLEELAPRMGKEVIVGQQKIAVFRLSDDRVKAIENVCPHKQGPLAEGTVSGDYVFCPLHDYKINLDDGQVQEPDEGCVRAYEAIVEDDLVYIVV
ncbi:nitrite reductase small subunit NirD [Enterococcus sp. AZ101]|uniref:nitrite reductase small subunit NirD n=1 Tax=Enterococcus sp. AZ101 TaxID=2774742 RepID=UPI003D293769